MPPKNPLGKEDFRLTTWLLIGASLQSVLLLVLSRNLAILVTAFVLGSRMVAGVFRTYGYLHDPSTEGVRYGNHTVRFPNEDGSIPSKPSEKGVVMFVLGVSSNQYVSHHSLKGDIPYMT